MISVAMATFNGEKWIGEQLESILNQLGVDDEIVIADDGSTDNTIDIINSYNDKRITLLSFNNNIGVSANFERALLHTKGDYIFLADQDDIWFPNKTKNMLIALENSHMAMHDAVIVDAEKKTLFQSYFKTRKVNHGLLSNIFKNSYTGCFMAFRREILELALPIPKGVIHDHWIALIGETISKPRFINDVLVSWRRHNDTKTKFNKFQYNFFFKSIFDRIQISIELFKRTHQKAET